MARLSEKKITCWLLCCGGAQGARDNIGDTVYSLYRDRDGHLMRLTE